MVKERYRLELVIEGSGTYGSVSGEQKAVAVLIMSDGVPKPSDIRDYKVHGTRLSVHYELGEHGNVEANITGAGIVAYLTDAFENKGLRISEWEVKAY